MTKIFPFPYADGRLGAIKAAIWSAVHSSGYVDASGVFLHDSGGGGVSHPAQMPCRFHVYEHDADPMPTAQRTLLTQETGTSEPLTIVRGYAHAPGVVGRTAALALLAHYTDSGGWSGTYHDDLIILIAPGAMLGRWPGTVAAFEATSTLGCAGVRTADGFSDQAAVFFRRGMVEGLQAWLRSLPAVSQNETVPFSVLLHRYAAEFEASRIYATDPVWWDATGKGGNATLLTTNIDVLSACGVSGDEAQWRALLTAARGGGGLSSHLGDWEGGAFEWAQSGYTF